jgi:hypothetical protein
MHTRERKNSDRGSLVQRSLRWSFNGKLKSLSGDSKAEFRWSFPPTRGRSAQAIVRESW